MLRKATDPSVVSVSSNPPDCDCPPDLDDEKKTVDDDSVTSTADSDIITSADISELD